MGTVDSFLHFLEELKAQKLQELQGVIDLQNSAVSAILCEAGNSIQGLLQQPAAVATTTVPKRRNTRAQVLLLRYLMFNGTVFLLLGYEAVHAMLAGP